MKIEDREQAIMAQLKALQGQIMQHEQRLTALRNAEQQAIGALNVLAAIRIDAEAETSPVLPEA